MPAAVTQVITKRTYVDIDPGNHARVPCMQLFIYQLLTIARFIGSDWMQGLPWNWPHQKPAVWARFSSWLSCWWQVFWQGPRHPQRSFSLELRESPLALVAASFLDSQSRFLLWKPNLPCGPRRRGAIVRAHSDHCREIGIHLLSRRLPRTPPPNQRRRRAHPDSDRA